MSAGRPSAGHRIHIDHLEKIARLLDDAFRIPGTRWRIGLDPIIGLIPVAGDGISALASLWIVYQGRQLGAPTRSLLRMLWNIGVDFAVGSVPLIGDVIDVRMKVNRKNVDILARSLRRRQDADGFKRS